ncbi:MAG TPA: polyprenol monophosphomannose synthase [bacterium]|nr:polyprenol monophosphomannose synthase [bacterium]
MAVVLPTYNEADNIAGLIERLLAVKPPLTILVMDDQSPDGTAAVAEQLNRDGRVMVVRREPPRGRGYAGRDGFLRALALGADCVLEMDADGSHDPQYIPALLAALAEADVAVGSRYCPGGRVVGYGLTRKLNSATANFLSRLILGVAQRDATAGFRLFRRRVLEAIDLPTLISPGPSIVEEILYRVQQHGFTVREIPITFVNRVKGDTKIRLTTIVVWIATLLRVRFGRT